MAEFVKLNPSEVKFLHEQNPDLVAKYGIRQAPTLVIDDGVNTKKYVNASNIQKYVDELEE